MDISESVPTRPIETREVANPSPRDQTWAWLLAIFSLAAMIETIFFSQLRAFTPLYLPELGISPDIVARWTGLIASTTGLIGIPFLPLWGALADRYRRKPIIIRSYAGFLLIAVVLLPVNGDDSETAGGGFCSLLLFSCWREISGYSFADGPSQV